MQSPTVTAYCPGHISGYFRRIHGESFATTGSTGAGIVISEGVQASVTPAPDISVHVRLRDIDGRLCPYARRSPPVEYVLGKLGVTASVRTECRLPIGAGFGLSAAALLATLTAVNRSHSLGMAPRDLALLAHEAEVIHRTGLGDVASCQGGGRVVRSCPGIDAPIERSFDLPGPICAVSFGPIPTPSVLGSQEQMDRVAAAYPLEIPQNARDFFRISRRFSVESGLMTPEAETVIRHCDNHGIMASMTMLGNGVFAYGPGVSQILRPFGTVYQFTLAAGGARIISEVVS